MPLAAVANGLYVLAFLACPLSMGLMMWFMAKGMGARKHDENTASKQSGSALVDLKADQARLAEKIAALEEDPASEPLTALRARS